MMNATEFLRRLIAIDSTNPPGNETQVAEAIEARLQPAGLECRLMKSSEGRVSLVARLEGPRDRPALVLLSHTDVVGVEADAWRHPPFEGVVQDGAVWGRGALDMKGIAVLHAEAAAALAASGAERTCEVVLLSVADEEAGGNHGAKWLVDEHPGMCGFDDGRPPPEVLGEGAYGIAGLFDRPLMPVSLGEKSALWVELRAHGQPGHGSMPPRRQAPRNLAATVERVAGPRPPRVHPVMQEQFARFAEAGMDSRSPVFRALASRGGRVVATALAPVLRSSLMAPLLADTVTPTELRAGYKHNVVPAEGSASLDCRLLPDTDIDDFLARMRRTCSKRDVVAREVARHTGPVSSKGRLFHVIEDVCSRLPSDPLVVPTLSPAITDIRFFRRRGARGYGWVPMTLTLELLSSIHGHDERVPLEELDLGVEAMTEVVRRFATSSS